MESLRTVIRAGAWPEDFPSRFEAQPVTDKQVKRATAAAAENSRSAVHSFGLGRSRVFIALLCRFRLSCMIPVYPQLKSIIERFKEQGKIRVWEPLFRVKD